MGEEDKMGQPIEMEILKGKSTKQLWAPKPSGQGDAPSDANSKVPSNSLSQIHTKK